MQKGREGKCKQMPARKSTRSNIIGRGGVEANMAKNGKMCTQPRKAPQTVFDTQPLEAHLTGEGVVLKKKIKRGEKLTQSDSASPLGTLIW